MVFEDFVGFFKPDHYFTYPAEEKKKKTLHHPSSFQVVAFGSICMAGTESSLALRMTNFYGY